MASDRFVNNAISQLEDANRSPIYGYQHLSVLTLEEAVEKIIPFVPNVMDYVSTAKKKCNRSTILLTRDESAAIYLYSMPTSFFSCLNDTLRAEDRHALKPWFAFLKLFMTALEKLPSTKKTVWRGVSGNVGSVFDDGDIHIWWSINSCSTDTSVVEKYLDKGGTLFAIDTHNGKDISAFSTFPEEQEIVLMPGTRVYARCHSFNFENRFFLVHLEEETSQRESQTEPNYLVGLIKQEYQRNSRIERIMNSTKSFPIQQSYINLAIVETKEQQRKEKELLNAKHHDEIVGAFEEIYGIKTKVEIKNIFEKYKDQTKNILVLGRAGTGKTTFCRYVAYQWTTGAIWQQYQLVIFIRLRNLMEDRYPSLSTRNRYTLFDLVKTEYLSPDISEEYEKLLRAQFEKSHILWLLDGYDEIAQNVPTHLKYLFEQLLKTQHHILTSRPFLNILSYSAQLEITGFTDNNIKQYVKQFFEQIRDEIDDASLQAQKLLSFLECNSRVWSIAHIPVNLELICSLWGDTDWSETVTLTITAVYDKMIEWLCRRYLEKQDIPSNYMTKEDVDEHCHKELSFLESLAFNAMENNSVIIRPTLLRIASKESKCSLQHYPYLLNIGILKSLDTKPIGTHIVTDKNYYFVHLSFQEYFAARYLISALNGAEDQKRKAIDFIQNHKYDQRFELVLSFASGLASSPDVEQSGNSFWNTLLTEPLDLIGFRHVQLIIFCLEEASCNSTLPQYHESMKLVIKWINYLISANDHYSYYSMVTSLTRTPLLVNQPEILAIFRNLYKNENPDMKERASLLISRLPISNEYSDLIHLNLPVLDDDDITVQQTACEVLDRVREKAKNNKMINRLMVLLKDADHHVRWNACEALGRMGKKAATDEVINNLVAALDDMNHDVRSSACFALGRMGEKAAIIQVIHKLLLLLEDTNKYVRRNACQALEKMGEKAAIDQVINRLRITLGDTDHHVRANACKALGKMADKAATNEVINALKNKLQDTNQYVRRNADEALAHMIEKVTTNEAINALLIALENNNHYVRWNACHRLEKMGEKASTNEVIQRLVLILKNTDPHVRVSACETLSRLAERAVTNEMIDGLLNALDDTNEEVRMSACFALGRMDERAATDEVIHRLMIALEDDNSYVRRNACQALGKMNEKAATGDDVIKKLEIKLHDSDHHVRASACKAIGEIGEKATTKEIINGLLSALRATNEELRMSACFALNRMGKRAVTNEVIHTFTFALEDTNDYVRENACRMFGKMGERAAIQEVTDRLIIALEDANRDVRLNACYAFREMGENVANKEVINGLIKILGDVYHDVRWSAYEILVKMNERAADNEVINKLFNDLDDTRHYIRHRTCQMLGKMGENAANKKVIDRLLIALEDRSSVVRASACEALSKMGEKAAARNDVVSKLIDALGDIDDDVRSNASFALGTIGERIATKELINGLLNALGDTEGHIRCSACEVVAKIGEKVATNEIIDKLLMALRDRDDKIRLNACQALGKIGEKAGNNAVIHRLTVALTDTDYNVRSNACFALSRMGEKAATGEVINKLMIALRDTSFDVMWSAYESLIKMGDKVSTSEVINNLLIVVGNMRYQIVASVHKAPIRISEKMDADMVIDRLVDALGDKDEHTRSCACEVLFRIGEKTASNIIIYKLVTALTNRNHQIRWGACEALGKMGERAASKDVIDSLLIALRDPDQHVQSSACYALSRMGEEVATNEVVKVLLNVSKNLDGLRIVGEIADTVEEILDLMPRMSDLREDIVLELSNCISKWKDRFWIKIPPEKFVQVFLDTEISSWLSIIRNIFTRQGYGLTVTTNTIVVYSRKEPVKIPIPNKELSQHLENYFND